MKDHHRKCELCDQRAAVYCPSDSAFLCLRCDSRVHNANFLVARHLRRPLCSSCHVNITSSTTHHDHHHHSLCMACNNDHDDDTWSSSSSCVSSTDQSSATTTKRVIMKRVAAFNSADVTFLRWWRELGLRGSDGDYVVTSASEALGIFVERMAGVPLRVSMAAAFWIGLRGERRRRRRRRREVVTWREVRIVEEVTGVAARTILAVDAKLRREMTRMRVRRGRAAAEMEEGWAES